MRDSPAEAAFLHIIATSRLLETLRADRKEVFRAAADAQRIADYLLAFHPDWARRNDHAPDGEPACDDSPVASDTPGTERAEAA